MKLKELIETYSEELQDLLENNKVDAVNEISNVHDRTEAYAIKRFLKYLKNLNVETVKRKEVIDFTDYLLQNNINIHDGQRLYWVDKYLKSIAE